MFGAIVNPTTRVGLGRSKNGRPSMVDVPAASGGRPLFYGSKNGRLATLVFSLVAMWTLAESQPSGFGNLDCAAHSRNE